MNSPIHDYRYYRDVLPNQLRVVTVEMPYLHSAEIALYIRVGSRFETLENNGISHFLEHMLFRGSKNYPSSFLLNNAFESIGDGLYANTFREFTSFWTRILPENVHQGLEILSDLIHYPLLTDIEIERQIILEEIMEDLDEEGENLDINNISRSLLYPGDPLGFLVIGSRENVKEIQRRDLLAHFKRFYVPSNMILCVTGNVKREAILEAANRLLGDLSGDPVPPSPTLQVAQYFPMDHLIPLEGAQQTEILVSFRALREGDPEILKLILIQRLLDDGISSRMQRGICEKLGLAYDIDVSIDSFSDTGVFEVEVTVGEGKLYRIVEEILREIEQLKSQPVSEEELQKVKDRHKREFLFDLDSVRSMSIHFGEGELAHTPKRLEEIMAEVDQISPADIQALAKQIFRGENLNVFALGTYSRRERQDLKQLLKSR
ncbi:MAG TPA: pitrilysin family protein [Bdellovibrionota bacterium]|nr:pitrilysin family protein [Bdellovibrionota bacterium]